MTAPPWLSRDTPLLDERFPLPLDRPFTGAMAATEGVSRRYLTTLTSSGHLRRVVHGVYAVTQAPDSVRFRADALALVVPDCAVITDRTAAWLYGVPALVRGAHLVAPPLDVCQPEDTRTCRQAVTGGRRLFVEGEIGEVGGLRVTTPLRTAADLGRKLWRFDALAAIDGFLHFGVNQDDLIRMGTRFAGYRGVRQLRVLAPLGDGRSESPGESALRLHWYDACLPVPDLQFRIYEHGTGWELFRLDVPCPDVRYAAEYDGEEHHSSAEDVENDLNRRKRLLDEFGWYVDPFRKDDVYNPRTDIVDRLQEGFARARRNVTRWSP